MAIADYTTDPEVSVPFGYSYWTGGKPIASINYSKTTVDKAYNSYVGGYGKGMTPAINRMLERAGLVRKGAAPYKYANAYKTALTMLSHMQQANRKATLGDAISMLASGGGSGSPGGGGARAATYRDFATYTNAQLKQKATDAYESILGRKPTEAEIKAFGRALKAGAKAAPTVTRVSASGQTRRTTQGFDEAAFIAGYMSNHIPGGASDYDGLAGQVQDFISSFKTNYGVMPTSSFITDAIKTVVGAADRTGAQQNLEQQLKEQAQILFPALKDKINAGMTVRAIADPFISTWARLREVNDSNVGLDNTDIKAALSMQNENGEYTLMNIDEFAKKIRSSAEWLNTNNAKETMLGAADSILQQFGFKR